MLVIIRYKDGLSQKVPKVNYFGWDSIRSGVSDIVCERARGADDVNFSLAKSLSEISTITILSKSARLHAMTDEYEIRRGTTNITFDAVSEKFCGNLAYTGGVVNFSLEEI